MLRLAMRAGGGSVRDTLSVLDQLMVGAVDGKIPYDSAVALLGFTPDALIGEAIDAVADKNGEALYGVIQKVVVGGFDPRRFVEDCWRACATCWCSPWAVSVRKACCLTTPRPRTWTICIARRLRWDCRAYADGGYDQRHAGQHDRCDFAAHAPGTARRPPACRS